MYLLFTIVLAESQKPILVVCKNDVSELIFIEFWLFSPHQTFDR